MQNIIKNDKSTMFLPGCETSGAIVGCLDIAIHLGEILVMPEHYEIFGSLNGKEKFLHIIWISLTCSEKWPKIYHYFRKARNSV